MKLEEAEWIAGILVAALTPACERVTVAGSVRRKKPEVKDLEIVVVPILEAEPELGMFGALFPRESREAMHPIQFTDTISRLIKDGLISYDPKLPRNGDRYKRFIVSDPERPNGVALDLFVCDRENYGNTLCLRTGDADWSKLIVTQRRAGGLMPGYMTHHDGYLWHGQTRVECPTEERFFEALQLQRVEPEFRNLAMARKLAKEVARV